MSSLSLSGSSLSPPSPQLPRCVLKHWHLCLCGMVGGSARPPRWRSQQSCVLHVNRTTAQFQGPRLSERESHQTTVGPERKKKNLSGSCKCALVWFLPSVVWFVHTNRAIIMIPERTLPPGWSHKIKSSHADKLTTNSGHSDDLRAGRVLFLDNSQRDRGSCLPSRPVYGADTAQKKKSNRCRATHRLLLP